MLFHKLFDRRGKFTHNSPHIAPGLPGGMRNNDNQKRESTDRNVDA
jgi:hypothetical protein